MLRYRWLIAACAGSLLIAACGGGGGGNGAATVGTSTPTGASGGAAGFSNSAPAISGTPMIEVLEGDVYRFAPVAQDADGDPLVFDVTNRPPWARFDAATGRLEGTPSTGDVGLHTAVSIGVNDGRAETRLPDFDIAVVPVAHGSLTLTWQPPSENTDESPLTDLAGYNVYWGTVPDEYPHRVTIENPGLTTHVFEDLAPGTYYFATTAFNTDMIESDISEPVVVVVR